MTNKVLLIHLATLLFLFAHCRKEEVSTAPEITIFQPNENRTFSLPSTMLVEFSVEGAKPMKFVRVSVDDQNQLPLFSTKYIYPDTSRLMISVELNLDNPLQNNGPFYVHIAADDGQKPYHAFRQIELVNAAIKYKGFYLFKNTSVNHLQIDYVDANYNTSLFYEMDGTYVDAETTVNQDLLFTATSVPGKLYALDFQDRSVRWQQQPESPYPEYTDLYDDRNFIYATYENGRIAALSETSGLQKTGTKILVDSVPEKIGVSGNYFIGDFKHRTGQKRAWVSFYRATGVAYSKYATDIKVEGFFPSQEDGAIEFIGNMGGKGILGRYSFEDNQVTGQHIIDEGKIVACCKMNSAEYLVAIGNKVYVMAIMDGKPVLFAEREVNVIDVAFNPVQSQVFVATSADVKVYQYPGAQLLKTITSASDIKAIRLRLGY